MFIHLWLTQLLVLFMSYAPCLDSVQKPGSRACAESVGLWCPQDHSPQSSGSSRLGKFQGQSAGLRRVGALLRGGKEIGQRMLLEAITQGQSGWPSLEVMGVTSHFPYRG